MDVHVHHRRRQIQHQQAAGEFALHLGTFERSFHGGHHGAVADVAPIDVEILHTAAGAAASGGSDQAADPVHPFRAVHRHQVPAELTSQHGIGRAAHISVPGGDILGLALPHEFEADLRIAEGQPGDHIRHKGTLARILFEEFHSGGGVVEQIPHPDGGAHSPGGRLGRLLLPALVAVEGGKLAGLGPGQQLHPGDAGNGGQCFAPEAQGVDVVQVLLRCDLAGGVADEGGGDVFRFDAGAVVADLDQLDASRLDGNGDLGRTGVDGIFHQLFDHRGRTLHHFARSDQLGGMLIQNADDCHMDILLSCREHTQPERLPLRVFLSS